MHNVVCPSCHQAFAVDGVTKEELERALEKLPKPKEVDVKTIVDAVTSKIPSQMGDFCSRFPELCRQTNALERKVDQLNSMMQSHPVPTEQLVDIWASCPECKPKAEKLGLLKPDIEDKEPELEFPWMSRD